MGFLILDTPPTDPKPSMSIILASHSIFWSRVRLEPRPAFVSGLSLGNAINDQDLRIARLRDASTRSYLEK